MIQPVDDSEQLINEIKQQRLHLAVFFWGGDVMISLKTAALSVTSAIAAVSAATGAQAAVINYSFSDAYYENVADSAALSGTFTWDTDLDRIISSKIGLTGHRGNTIVECSNCTTGIYNPEHFAINLGGNALYITFADSLSSGGNVALSLRAATQSNEPQYQGRSSFTTVRGSAIAAVPEPATWALMLLGFGMVAASARYRRKTATVTFA
jgi:hypothetical protein